MSDAQNALMSLVEKNNLPASLYMTAETDDELRRRSMFVHRLVRIESLTRNCDVEDVSWLDAANTFLAGRKLQWDLNYTLSYLGGGRNVDEIADYASELRQLAPRVRVAAESAPTTVQALVSRIDMDRPLNESEKSYLTKATGSSEGMGKKVVVSAEPLRSRKLEDFPVFAIGKTRAPALGAWAACNAMRIHKPGEYITAVLPKPLADFIEENTGTGQDSRAKAWTIDISQLTHEDSIRVASHIAENRENGMDQKEAVLQAFAS